MNSYQETFEKLTKKQQIAFIPFWMIGDDSLENSEKFINKIAENADCLELGLPFSDPQADGKIIQDSVKRALKNDISMQNCLDLIGRVRKNFPGKPIGLLVYFNLILQFGIDEFCKQCQEKNINSILIPEITIDEFDLIEKYTDKYKLNFIFIVSTNTKEERLSKILKVATGFLYVISKPSITGNCDGIPAKTLDFIKDLKTKTDLPLVVGFGISSPQDLQILKKAGANGGIIASKLFEFRNDISALDSFCKECRSACQ